MFKNWKAFEVIWLSTFLVIATVLTIIWKDNIFGFSVFVTGVFCVVLAAKGNIWTYFFGMYNTFAYAYLSWTNHLYGEVSLNLLFFVPMNIIGFLMWKNKMNGDKVEMKALSIKIIGLIVVFCIFSIFIFGKGLSLIPNQNSPYIDATTNILSIIATFLMVLRYKEQWILYIVLNIFTVILWSYRFASGSPDGLMMMIMWFAYLINAFYGYINWSNFV